MNRYHPAPGVPAAAVEAVPSQADPVAVAVGGQAADTGAVARALPVGPFGGQTVFLHCDVFCLPAHGASVSAARSRITEQLDSWGVDESVYEDAALIVSELFTNALVHTDSSEIVCRLQTTAQTVLLAVTDQGHGPCGPRVREPDVESGRGLILVSALAELWGVNTEQAEGRTVWALLPCKQGSASGS